LRAAKTLAIFMAAGLASHIAAILVAILRVEVLVVSPSMASGEMALFLLQNVSRRRADARRGFVMFLIMHLFLLTSLSSLIVFVLFPLGNNKICIFVSALGLSSLFCSRARVVFE
jgi:hypothetical protein